tara:strand:- start:284 stop:574 length:291 start_codon:yes stop_codon:yes gene_type:complete
MVKFSEYNVSLSCKEEIDFSELYQESQDRSVYYYRCKLVQALLKNTDWMITRHQEQILANTTPKLTDEELAILIKNRVEARKALKQQISYVTNDTE